MAIFKRKVTANDVLTRALAEVGYTEKPVNKTKYGEYFNMNGAQWCGLFVQWVWTQAGWKVGKDFPYTYYTPAGVAGWTKKGKIESKGKGIPQPGAQLFFNFPNDSLDRVSHTGFYVASLKTAQGRRWLTIEGNTAGPKKGSTDQRNGGEVAIKLRDPKDIVCWADPDYVGDSIPVVHEIIKRWELQNKPKPVKKAVKKTVKKVKK